ERFTPHHPAILRQLKMVLDAGREHDITVSVCGEMASDPLSAVLLMGLGYRILSVAPPSLPLLKWVVRRGPAHVAGEPAGPALLADRPSAVTAALRDAVKDYIDVRLL